MKVTDEMIHAQLRPVGSFCRRFLQFDTPRAFARLQRLMILAKHFMRVKGVDKEECVIQRRNGTGLRLCIFRSKAPKRDAVGLLWLHGGGYAIGAPEQDAQYIQNFVTAANCVVVAPDYTLSLKAPYPAALKDSYAALLWMRDNAEKLGIRSDKLFVGGNSAGGGLAVATCLLARDKGEVHVAFQMPLYPMLDDRMITPSSQHNDAPVWNTRANIAAWRLYLGPRYRSAAVPVYAAPARETDYSRLPPAYTFVGSIEPFCDETKAYIAHLQKAGVRAEIEVYPGCFHGFNIACPRAPISRQATDAYLQKFRYAALRFSAPQPVKQMPRQN